MNIVPCFNGYLMTIYHALEDELFEFVTAIAEGEMSFEQIAPWIEARFAKV